MSIPDISNPPVAAVTTEELVPGPKAPSGKNYGKAFRGARSGW
ncbi:MAG: hypothetical protein ABIZ64_01590 [Casimicrobium sp.]